MGSQAWLLKLDFDTSIDATSDDGPNDEIIIKISMNPALHIYDPSSWFSHYLSTYSTNPVG